MTADDGDAARVSAACHAAGRLSHLFSDPSLSNGLGEAWRIEQARDIVDELTERLGLSPVDWPTGRYAPRAGAPVT